VKEREQTPFRYPNYDAGALRLIDIESLLRPDPAIDIIECRNLKLHENPSLTKFRPRYAAISHVWKASEEVKRLSSLSNRPFRIDIKNHSEQYSASWHGLIQAATAGRNWSCQYLWLDLLCVHQLADDDKRLQIENMSKIYKNATIVLIMFGGCAAAQGLNHPSQWMERAWTLQESTVNKNTFGLIDMQDIELIEGHTECTIASVGATIRRLTEDITLGLIHIRELLKVNPREPLGRIMYHGVPVERSQDCGWSVECLGKNPRAIKTMEIIFDGINKEGRGPDDCLLRSAVWANIWMRTSTKRHDIVFSLMHLLGVLDLAADYRRPFEQLFLDLVHRSSAIPVLLAIAPRLEVTDTSLLPTLPQFTPNEPPFYSENEPASDFLIDPDYFTARMSIVVHSEHPEPFILCGTMLNISPCPGEFLATGPGCIIRDLQFWTPMDPFFPRRCIVYGEFGEIALIVGQHREKNLACQNYSLCDVSIIFLDKSRHGVWNKVGQGILEIQECEKELLTNVNRRRHIEVGTNKTKPCTCWDGKKKADLFSRILSITSRSQDLYHQAMIELMFLEAMCFGDRFRK
jgi:Heterokaryon incompatibility protein (HET)